MQKVIVILSMILLLITGCNTYVTDPVKAFKKMDISETTGGSSDVLISSSDFHTEGVKLEIGVGERLEVSFETQPGTGEMRFSLVDEWGSYLYDNNTAQAMSDNLTIDKPGIYLFYIVGTQFTGTYKYEYKIN